MREASRAALRTINDCGRGERDRDIAINSSIRDDRIPLRRGERERCDVGSRRTIVSRGLEEQRCDDRVAEFQRRVFSRRTEVADRFNAHDD